MGVIQWVHDAHFHIFTDKHFLKKGVIKWEHFENGGH